MISIDPGDVHVGVSLWKYNKELIDSYEITPEEVVPMIRRIDPLVIVVEAFHLYPGKAAAQTHSTMKTPRLIGQIVALKEFLDFKMIEQPAHVRKVAERSPWGKDIIKNFKPKSKHALDSLFHGVYYLYFGKGSDN